MCGRFRQHYTWAEVHAFLSVFGTLRNLQLHYNIAPTMTVDVIKTGKHGGRELVRIAEIAAQPIETGCMLGA